ncbi:head GIN domain-containing protein [Tsuneonella sp. HG222]
MGFKKVLQGLGPVIAIAVAAGIAGCDKAKFTVNGREGVPLADLDLTGMTPTEVVLLGPDNLEIRTGEALSIEVDGDPAVVERLRFALDGETLAVMRGRGEGSGTATIIVTLPSPRKLTVGGSGSITAAELIGKSEVNVLGSGSLSIAGISADRLSVTIAGSGSLRGGGKAERLDLDVLGSGSAHLDELTVDRADVTIAGSGGAAFRSDGEVEAEILGSGSVTVRGDARCKVHSVGSGTLVCERNTEPAV